MDKYAQIRYSDFKIDCRYYFLEFFTNYLFLGGGEFFVAYW